MHKSALRIDLSQIDGSTFLAVRGELDADSVGKLRAVLDSVHLERRVVVDMSDVGFMDSSGVNALIEHTMRIELTGGSLRIANPSRAVHRVIEITGLAHLFYERQNH